MLVLASIAAAVAQDIPANATISEALVVNVTPEGLDQVGGLVSGFLPLEGIALDPISLSGGGGFCLLEYDIDVSNMNIALTVTDTQVIPSPGTLDILIDAMVGINDPADKFQFSFDAICLSDDCPGYVDAFPVSIALPISLAIVQDPVLGPTLDATLGQVVVNNGLMGNAIHMDCSIQTIENVLDLLGLSLYDFIIGFAEDFLIDEINNQAAAIEVTIEDAFASATIDQTVEVLPGVSLDIHLAPEDIQVTSEGVVLAMEASVAADQNPCVAAFDPGSSHGTSGAPPAIAAEPAGTQIAAHASDDFVNQALYGVWRSGLLCQELSEGEFGGFAIDTALLGLLGGAPYQDLFPDTSPMIIKTVPNVPLEARFDGPHDLDIPIENLEVLFFAELDGRMARALGVSISPDVGVDLVFDDAIGELAVDLQIGSDFRTAMSGDLMVPGAEQEIVDNVDGVLVGLVDTLLGSLLGDAIAFAVPSLDGGIGLTSLQAQPSGGGEWLGIYAEIGPVTYPASDCADGCSGGTGCTSSQSSVVGFALLLGVLIRRRR
ncbi:MAG: hypothetical protein R3F61_16250 [Myxococcota bacterium]